MRFTTFFPLPSFHLLRSLKIKISAVDFFSAVVQGVKKLMFHIISYIYPICLSKIPPFMRPPSAFFFLFTFSRNLYLSFSTTSSFPGSNFVHIFLVT